MLTGPVLVELETVLVSCYTVIWYFYLELGLELPAVVLVELLPRYGLNTIDKPAVVT